jgi:hypothetical protein
MDGVSMRMQTRLAAAATGFFISAGLAHASTLAVDGYYTVTSQGWAITPTISFDLDPTPRPGALPLFATGLGAIGLFGWRNNCLIKVANRRFRDTGGPGTRYRNLPLAWAK